MASTANGSNGCFVRSVALSAMVALLLLASFAPADARAHPNKTAPKKKVPGKCPLMRGDWSCTTCPNATTLHQVLSTTPGKMFPGMHPGEIVAEGHGGLTGKDMPIEACCALCKNGADDTGCSWWSWHHKPTNETNNNGGCYLFDDGSCGLDYHEVIAGDVFRPHAANFYSFANCGNYNSWGPGGH